MNPLTNIRNVQKLNDTELELGVDYKLSWHQEYKDSAYVYIGGLPFNLTEGDVIAVFSQYGEPIDVNLVRDKATGKSRGFCFLGYEDQRSTVLAVDNLNGAKVNNRTLRVDHVKDYKRPEEEKDESGDEEGGYNSDEGKIPMEAIEERLKKIKKEKKKKKKKKKSHSSSGSDVDEKPVKSGLAKLKMMVREERSEMRLKTTKHDDDVNSGRHAHGERHQGRDVSPLDRRTGERADGGNRDHSRRHQGEDRSYSGRNVAEREWKQRDRLNSPPSAVQRSSHSSREVRHGRSDRDGRRSRSPRDVRRARSPPEARRDYSSREFRRDYSPQEAGRDHSPRKGLRSKSPRERKPGHSRKVRRSRSPEDRSLSPREIRRSRSPEDIRGSSHKRVKHRSPKVSRNDSPSREVKRRRHDSTDSETDWKHSKRTESKQYKKQPKSRSSPVVRRRHDSDSSS